MVYFGLRAETMELLRANRGAAEPALGLLQRLVRDAFDAPCDRWLRDVPLFFAGLSTERHHVLSNCLAWCLYWVCT